MKIHYVYERERKGPIDLSDYNFIIIPQFARICDRLGYGYLEKRVVITNYIRNLKDSPVTEV